jgi:TRAP-type C4-dicarboxylate transport system permease small subunit
LESNGLRNKKKVRRSGELPEPDACCPGRKSRWNDGFCAMSNDRNHPIKNKGLALTYSISMKVVSFCLLAMTILVACDIVLRTVFDVGIPGTVETNEYLLVIVGFMGIVETNGRRGHITVDLFYEKVSEGRKRILNIISPILVLLFTLLFLYAGAQRAFFSYQSGETNWFGSHVLPVWFFRWIVPIGCVLLSCQLVTEFWRVLNRIPDRKRKQ